MIELDGYRYVITEVGTVVYDLEDNYSGTYTTESEAVAKIRRNTKQNDDKEV